MDFLALKAVSFLLLMAISGIICWRHARILTPVINIMSALCCLVVAGESVVFALDGFNAPITAVIKIGLPGIDAHFRLDDLSTIFLFLIGTLGALVSIFAVSYTKHDLLPHRVMPFYPAFLAGMMIVTLADDAMTFFIGWEVMSISSWMLILSRQYQPLAREAAYLYIVIAIVGASALLVAFTLLAEGQLQNLTFTAIASNHHSTFVLTISTGLVLFGAGSKAGLVPLHVWLPEAHSSAPIPASALMSGVMTKVAIYGILRYFTLVGHFSWEWGVFLLLVGAVSAFWGALYSLLEQDLKRLLSYSTIENIGIIVIGLGIFIICRDDDKVRTLALAGLLLHIFAHGFGKTLAFLSTSVIERSVGTRDLANLGGLARKLPVISSAFGLGCLSLAALPPLAGFASEWTLLHAVMMASNSDIWAVKLAAPLALVLFGFAAGLSAFAFTRALGMSLFGRPRHLVMGITYTPPLDITIILITIAAFVVVIGIEPRVLLILLPFDLPSGMLPANVVYNGKLLLVGLFCLSVITFLVVRYVFRPRVLRAHAWDCGTPDARPVTQYSPMGFSQLAQRLLAEPLLCSSGEVVEMPDPGDPRPSKFTVVLHNPFMHYLYLPIAQAVLKASRWCNLYTSLSIQMQLTVMCCTLVFLLVFIGLLR